MIAALTVGAADHRKDGEVDAKWLVGQPLDGLSNRVKEEKSKGIGRHVKLAVGMSHAWIESGGGGGGSGTQDAIGAERGWAAAGCGGWAATLHFLISARRSSGDGWVSAVMMPVSPRDRCGKNQRETPIEKARRREVGHTGSEGEREPHKVDDCPREHSGKVETIRPLTHRAAAFSISTYLNWRTQPPTRPETGNAFCDWTDRARRRWRRPRPSRRIRRSASHPGSQGTGSRGFRRPSRGTGGTQRETEKGQVRGELRFKPFVR